MSSNGLLKLGAAVLVGGYCIYKIKVLEKQVAFNNDAIKNIYDEMGKELSNENAEDAIWNEFKETIDSMPEKFEELKKQAMNMAENITKPSPSDPLGSAAPSFDDEVPVEPGFNDDEFNDSEIPVEPGFEGAEEDETEG